MKIGLLTHHWPANFGANLQAYSTVKALESMGHEVHVLNYRPVQMRERYESTIHSLQTKEHEEFISEHLMETRQCDNQEGLVMLAKELKLGCIICGSDAVLRLNKNSDREDLSFPNPFWLDWVEEGVRVGFLAASCMGSQFFVLPRRTRIEISNVVKALDYCSVRDSWSQLMLRVCGVPAFRIHHCPDPVCAILPALKEVDTSNPDSNSPYILLSLYPHMLSEEWTKAFVEKANEQGYQVYGLPQPDVKMKGPVNRSLELPMAPMDWYRWIANASGYVGIRFHPIMLAQINSVPYVAFDEYDVGLVFRNRIMRMIARILRPVTRRCSKTYDASLRAGKGKYCIPPRQYDRMTPVKVLEMLQEQKIHVSNNDINTDRYRCFMNTLMNIIGENKTT